MVDYPSADRKTKKEVLRTLEVVEQASAPEIKNYLEKSTYFSSSEEILIACEELVGEGRIQEVERSNDGETAYRLSRN